MKTEATVEERLTEEQCWELFQNLFPNGLDDPSLVQKLAPDGWERSPLVLVYHPTAEQVYEETLRFRDNLRQLRGKPATPEEEPQIMLDALRREMPVDAPKPAEECADPLTRWAAACGTCSPTTMMCALQRVRSSIWDPFALRPASSRTFDIAGATPRHGSTSAESTSNSTLAPGWSGTAQI